MSLTVSLAAAHAQGAALATTIGSNPSILIYSGSKPATPETGATGTLLVTIPITGSFSDTNGTLTAADPAAVNPSASGTAGWFRLQTSGGTAILDGTVGTSGTDMIVGTTTITEGTNFDLGAPSFTVPGA